MARTRPQLHVNFAGLESCTVMTTLQPFDQVCCSIWLHACLSWHSGVALSGSADELRMYRGASLALLAAPCACQLLAVTRSVLAVVSVEQMRCTPAYAR